MLGQKSRVFATAICFILGISLVVIGYLMLFDCIPLSRQRRLPTGDYSLALAIGAGSLGLVFSAPRAKLLGISGFLVVCLAEAMAIVPNITGSRVGEANMGAVLAAFVILIPLGVLVGIGAFVASLISLTKAPSGCCAKCGYDLRGLPEPRCPECGTPFDPKAVPSHEAKTNASESGKRTDC
jgi:hypothetical protein